MVSQNSPSTPLAPTLGGGRLGNWGTPLILRRVYDQTLGKGSPSLCTPDELCKEPMSGDMRNAPCCVSGEVCQCRDSNSQILGTCRDLSPPGLGVPPRFLSSVPKESVAARAHRNISLHRRPRGVQRGEAPLRFSCTDPPRMGARGVDRSPSDSLRKLPLTLGERGLR